MTGNSTNISKEIYNTCKLDLKKCLVLVSDSTLSDNINEMALRIVMLLIIFSNNLLIFLL